MREVEVAVTNRHPFDVKDGYNGMKWIFRSGEKVLVPYEAAVHMFGYKQENKASTMSRHGKSFEEGHKFLNGFEFSEVKMVPKEILEEESRVTPLKAELDEAQKTIDRLMKENEALKKDIEGLRGAQKTDARLNNTIKK